MAANDMSNASAGDYMILRLQMNAPAETNWQAYEVEIQAEHPVELNITH